MQKRKYNICLAIIIISGFFAVYMNIDNVYKAKAIYDKFEGDVIKIKFYEYYVAKPNYFNGLWLMPTGIMFIFLLVLLDIPSFQDIKKEFFNIIKKKREEIKDFKKYL